jgi:hypothetical protein
MICPFFGELPPWMPQWTHNTERMAELGYNFLFDEDEDSFRERVGDILGFTCPALYGSGKIWDFRPALGLLYEEECKGYDFWGHTDFDCVYGRVEMFVTDEFLQEIDMHSNCATYVNGCWSLYRNTDQMRELFMETEFWGEEMTDPRPTGWAEKEFSGLIAHFHEEGRLVKAWTQWQEFEAHRLAQLRFDEEKLICGKEEVMMAHFRRTKVYPVGCLR